MSNAIRISRTGDGDSNFRLQSTRFSVSHDRSPIAAPLPASNPLLIDLGQWRVNIVIEGVAAVAGTDRSDGGISIADRDDLENMADPTIGNPWYSETITVTDDTTSPAVSYTVKIAKVSLEKQDVRNFWTFTIACTGHIA